MPASCPCGFEFSECYRNVDLFLTLVGTGVHRSVYYLTARERPGRRLLFGLRVAAELDALLLRSHRAGAAADAPMVALAFDYAHRIVDAGVNDSPARYLLEVGSVSEVLVPAVP